MGSKSLRIRFLKGEMLDHAVYATLAMHEKNATLRRLLNELAAAEQRHMDAWRKLIGRDGLTVRKPAFIGIRSLLMVLIERVFGVAFVTRLLERNESRGLAAYGDSLDNKRMGKRERRITLQIIEDEKGHEASLANVLETREEDLAYMQSTLLGLNDGLVEILAVVAGIAAVASTSLIVVIIGIISGISGTLSMAGGVYIASKSERLVIKEHKGTKKARIPAKEAYHTGAYYFLGALIAVMPFVFGMTGALGILTSVLLVSITLVAASVIVAVVSGTSMKRRALEMLAISLGAAFVTVLFGTLVKVYFGVRI